MSVKRETSLNGQSADGVVSNHLHDQVQVGDILEVGPPCGEFILDPAVAATRPLVFIAGGVGITPLLSMLNSVVHHGPRQPIHFVQAATNRPRHAFHEELATLAHSCPLLTTHVRYSQPLAADRLAARHHSEGTVDRAFLDSLIAKSPPGAEFYFCGPAPFMRVIAQRLHDHQIADTRIHYEFFGPKLQLTAA
ncbi:MAG: hypothetical protein C0478_03105 [Planctomyces sp.]|nr:hypothetical protein [Planctomyces sp.]